MSITYQNLNLPTGLYNLPKSIADITLSRSAFQLVGTPTASQVVVSALHDDLQFTAVVYGSFQYPNGVPANSEDIWKNGSGNTTQIEVSVNGVLIERTLFNPGVDTQLEIQSDSSKAAAQVIYSGHDTFIGFNSGKATSASDTVDGFGGNDIFYGNGIGDSSDIFYGGSGTDTSVFRGKKANYTMAQANI